MCAEPNYASLLQDRGLSATPHRLIVLEIIGNSQSPLTPLEIFATLERGHRMNKVTLYRILDLLVENGLVERIPGADRTFRYGLAPADHHRHAHFFCSSCGGMQCLSPEALSVDVPSFQKRFPALIKHVDIRLDGICKDCLRRQAQ
jgi:Fur family transcriptional regulator, ferric uptake regulator